MCRTTTSINPPLYWDRGFNLPWKPCEEQDSTFLYFLIHFLYAYLIWRAWWAAGVEEHQREPCQGAFPPIAARYTARNTTHPAPGTATVAQTSAQGSDNTLGTVETWVWRPSQTKAHTFARPGLKERPCLPTWVTILPLFLYRDRLAKLSVLQLFWRMSPRWLSLHQLLMLSNLRRYCDSYRFSHMTSHSLREDKQTSCMFCNICFRGFSGKMFEAVSKLDWGIVWTFSPNNQDAQRWLHLLYICGYTPQLRGTDLDRTWNFVTITSLRAIKRLFKC